MNKVTLQGRVALVTGAGGGLGRSHALWLSKMGASVVVNDVGGSVMGVGHDATRAQETVALIQSSGGQSVADASSVETLEGAQQMVETAVKSFGRLDIVVNNAGILRDGSFAKQDDEMWESVVRVHLTGSRHVTKAAWKIMCDQKYGRIVMTSSASGLYGNFGQSNYAAAKMGVVGLMNALKEEGAKYNIKINAIAPMAKSRMTESILPEEILEKLDPRFVSPVVAYLCSESCEVSGQCWAVGGGRVSRVSVMESPGVFLPSMNVEDIAQNLEKITSLEGAEAVSNLSEAASRLLREPS